MGVAFVDLVNAFGVVSQNIIQKSLEGEEACIVVAGGLPDRHHQTGRCREVTSAFRVLAHRDEAAWLAPPPHPPAGGCPVWMEVQNRMKFSPR